VIGQSVTVDAYHESGHVVIGNIIGVPVRRVTIAPPAHVTLSMAGILKMALSDGHRAVFFLAGMTVQKYYFPSIEITSKNDQAVLWGLPEYRRKTYKSFISEQLADPTVRKDIETLAARLLKDISISF
jgi:hypothetical protein